MANAAMLTSRQVSTLLATIAVLSLPAWLAPTVGPAVTALATEIDVARPYLPNRDHLLLYVLVPLSIAGSFVLLMSPGLLAILAIGRGATLWQWVLEGYLVSLGVVSGATAALQAAIGRPVTGGLFIGLVLGLAATAGGMLLIRSARRLPVRSPFSTPASAWAVSALLVVPAVVAILLLPKFFWEAFNGDGAHTFEAARLLLHRTLPFFSPEAGVVSSWPGVPSMVVPYPASWFMRLFGPSEVAVRLPMLLCMPLLVAAVVAVAEAGRDRPVEPAGRVLIWGSVVSFTLVMCYSATYDPYLADPALPGPMDALAMVAFLAAVQSLVRGEPGWAVVWTLLTLMSSPAALVLVAGTVGLTLLTRWPMPWRLTTKLGGALALCLAGLALVPWAVALAGSPPPGGEHDALRLLLRQFAYIALADFERFGWAFLPCGLYVGAGLLVWKRADLASRALIAVTLALFAMYYTMGTVALHYFVPVMLLPLAIFWREFRMADLTPVVRLASAASIGLAVWLALPASWAIHDATRRVGERFDVKTFASYHRHDPLALAATEQMSALFPMDMHEDVPDRLYGGSPLAWNYYAQRAAATDQPKPYRLDRSAAPVPDMAIRVASDRRAAVFVLDEAAWEADRRHQPSRSSGKAVFEVPRHVLFYRRGKSERPGFFAPGLWVLERAGPLLDRWGLAGQPVVD
jgi:hypothetical protein